MCVYASDSRPSSPSELQVRIKHDIDIFINIQYECMCVYAPDSRPSSPSELQVRIKHDLQTVYIQRGHEHTRAGN